MITAVFTSGFDHTEVSGLWQYDYGQKLRIQGLNLPPAVEIHFSLSKSGGDSESRVGVTRDGVTDVPIPDSMLENGGTIQNYYIYAFIYITDETSGKTVKWVQLHVNSRPKPEAFNSPEEKELFREAIAAVNESADRAETAEKSSEAWAHGHNDYPERDENNAKFYSDKAREKAEETASNLQKVSNLANQVIENAETVARDKNITEEFKNKAGESAENAAVSESNAALHENNAKEAQTKAETAQRAAEEAKKQVANDKEEVFLAKTAVEESEKNVIENKEYVRQTVENFTSLAENAVYNVNVAGQNQVNNIEEAGQAALDNISTGVDEGLTQSGKAADAKKTGERIDELKSDLVELDSRLSESIENISNRFDEVVGKNIFDKSKIIRNKSLSSSSGSIVDVDGYCISDFIEVKEGETYTISYAHTMPYYDATQKFVANGFGTIDNSKTFTIPNGVKYIRFSTGLNLVDTAQVEVGTKTTKYEEYTISTKLKDECLPNDVATKDYIDNRVPISDKSFRPIKCNVQSGYYDGVNFIPHGSYQSIKIDVAEGEIYRISTYLYAPAKGAVAWLYDAKGTLIKKVGGFADNPSFEGGQVNDYEVEIPSQCVTLITTNYKIVDNINFVVKKYLIGVMPLYGMNAIYIGDSITAISNGWRPSFNEVTGANEVRCTAVSGATICDYADTIVNGDCTSSEHQNTLSNQVKSIMNNPPTEDIDFIIIAMGTNDHADASEFDGGVTQFVNGNNYIDVDTVDRKRYDGAMRWACEKLWDLFPYADIFFVTPIQGAERIRQTWVQIRKCDYMKEIAAYLGTPCIDATRNSGIYGRYENANASGKYLNDGLHPNMYGRKKLGRYYASEIIKYYNYFGD